MKKGSNLTEEHKRKLAIAMKGRILSQETRQKISKASTGRLHTEEAKRKIAESKNKDTQIKIICEFCKQEFIAYPTNYRIISNIRRFCSKECVDKARIGQKRSPESIEKGRLKHIGQKRSKEFCERMTGKNHPLYGISPPREHIERLRAINIGNKYNQGRIPNNNSRLKMSKAQKGRIASKETRQKMSMTQKRLWSNPETRQKTSITQKRLWSNPEYIKRMTENPNQFFNTRPEREMKKILDRLNIKYEHNKLRAKIPHAYLTDFYLPDYNCIIETDGLLFHAHPSRFKPEDVVPLIKITAQQKWEEDAIRTKELIEIGYKVLRFWENEISEEIVRKRLLEVN